jgi:hypothetical protein
MYGEIFKVISQNPSENKQQVIFRATASNKLTYFTKHLPIDAFAKPLKIKTYTRDYLERLRKQLEAASKNLTIAVCR